MYTALYSKMANAHWPLAPVANGHWPLLLYKPYTSDTRGVKAFQSYTALYSAIQYTAIQRYTLYNLYITPLRWPFGEHSDYRLVIDTVVIALARKKNEAVFLLLSRRHHLTDLGLACALRGLRRLCDTRRFGRGRFEALHEH